MKVLLLGMLVKMTRRCRSQYEFVLLYMSFYRISIYHTVVDYTSRNYMHHTITAFFCTWGVVVSFWRKETSRIISTYDGDTRRKASTNRICYWHCDCRDSLCWLNACTSSGRRKSYDPGKAKDSSAYDRIAAKNAP